MTIGSGLPCESTIISCPMLISGAGARTCAVHPVQCRPLEQEHTPSYRVALAVHAPRSMPKQNQHVYLYVTAAPCTYCCPVPFTPLCPMPGRRLRGGQRPPVRAAAPADPVAPDGLPARSRRGRLVATPACRRRLEDSRASHEGF
jgi:hypothetical protein